MRFKACGEIDCWVDGKPVTVTTKGIEADGLTSFEIALETPVQRQSVVAMRIAFQVGRIAGAAFEDPIAIDCGRGRMEIGDWGKIGVLENYSGAMRYRRTFAYGTDGELLVETGSSGQVIREYVYLNGQPLAVLDQVTEGPQLVVGSSMGGWIMLLTALQRPGRVAGLVGIAAAPDFTESLWRDGLDEGQRESLERDGYCDIPNCYDDGEPYRIGRGLLEEGRDHLLLEADIPIDLPVRLLHGQLDEDVPWEHSLTVARHLHGADVEVLLVKDGDHRLSRSRDLARLIRTVDALLEQLG